MTKLRPITEVGPSNLIKWSSKKKSAFSWPYIYTTFPKSPTCLSSSFGPPWFFPNGL